MPEKIVFQIADIDKSLRDDFYSIIEKEKISKQLGLEIALKNFIADYRATITNYFKNKEVI